jgi:hypothetical protein
MLCKLYFSYKSAKLMLCKLYCSYKSAKYVPHLFSIFFLFCAKVKTVIFTIHIYFPIFMKLDKRDFHKILLSICDFFKKSAQASA